MDDLTPASPCTGVCTLDADDVCVGCGRTIDEIAAWGSMTMAARAALMAALSRRKSIHASVSASPYDDAAVAASSIAAART